MQSDSTGWVPENDAHDSKVPEVTLLFWIIKIAATTLGETAGDAASMSMNLGYLVSSAVFLVLFVVVVFAQIAATRFRPGLYWLTIIATTTLGTTVADFADRSLSIGYAGGAAVVLALLLLSLFCWHRVLGSVAVSTVHGAKAEWFYWITILLSQTLGTALGDWTADTEGLGFAGGVAVFSALLALCAGAYCWTSLSRTFLFWTAFILTRPLGAVVGDLLDKPLASGGFAWSRYSVSALLLVFIALCIAVFPQRAARAAGRASGAAH